MSIKSLLFNLLPEKTKQTLHRKKLFMNGYNTFLQTGQTPQESYMELINLYCSSKGKFNEAFNNKLKSTNPAKKINTSLEGVVGNFSKNEFDSVNTELNENGYYHFEKKLAKETCESLYKYALTIPAVVPGQAEKIIFNPEKPISEIYRLEMGVIANNPIVQQLMMDPALINIARNYLGCEPILDFPAMWWSTSFKKEASSEAAQLYHFDMDRIKWLKIFFYINDVTLENGPHSYISGSHKAGAKPEELLKRGYKRIPDEDLLPHYNAHSFKVVCGEAGSIFAGDTKCWHKGLPLKKGHRLVLELEYTSSLFGANYPKLEIFSAASEFRDFCKTNKVYSSNIHFTN